ncbi:MAG: AMP-binding protein [Acidimicrobiales bacterium]|nr:AMP-binding protein [Acidimicrobiales bacterium]
MPGANLFYSLMRTAVGEPGRVLFHLEDGSHLTYGTMADRSAQFAHALMDHRVERGDRLVVQIDKSADAVALWLACLRSGVMFVPLNTAYTDAEVDGFVADADTPHLVTTPARGRGLTLGIKGDGSLGVAANSQSLDHSVADVKPDDPAAMLFTSGTTGRSKGAVITHRGLLSNAHALAEVWQISESDHLLHTLPVFHVHGLFVALHPLMVHGAQITILPRFDTDAVITRLPGATVLMGVPTHYIRLLSDDRFDRNLTAHMRLFTSGSAPMTAQVHELFTERTGRTITERYGMTECGIITSNSPGSPKPGTVGTALPEMDLRVGADSMVEVRGPHLFDRYWRRPEATAESFSSDGWFRTGDIGTLDDDRVLTLSGRASDLIISGGYNIYPKEIEHVLDDDPQINESAVVGWADPEWGETVVAFVVLADPDAKFTPPDLDDRLAGFKHPRHWEVVDSLPRNAMGKVQKKALRDLA